MYLRSTKRQNRVCMAVLVSINTSDVSENELLTYISIQRSIFWCLFLINRKFETAFYFYICLIWMSFSQSMWHLQTIPKQQGWWNIRWNLSDFQENQLDSIFDVSIDFFGFFFRRWTLTICIKVFIYMINHLITFVVLRISISVGYRGKHFWK